MQGLTCTDMLARPGNSVFATLVAAVGSSLTISVPVQRNLHQRGRNLLREVRSTFPGVGA